MPSTTIRLEDELKARVAAAAGRAGKTTHAFIVEAIAVTVEQNEVDDEFQRVAEQRWAKVLATGNTISFDDAKAHLLARAQGSKATRPATRKPPRR